MIIRKPTAQPAPTVSAPTFTVDRPLAGLKAGIRKDRAWRSWQFIAEIWDGYLRRDGAADVLSVETLSQVGEVGAADRKHVDDLAEATDFARQGELSAVKAAAPP